MAGKIASTSFQTGPDDSVAVPDVYADVVTTTPLNTVIKTANVLKDSAGNVISDTGKVAISLAKDSFFRATSLSGVTKVLTDSIANGKLTLDSLSDIPRSKEEALDLLKGIAGDKIGELNKLKDLKGPLLEQLVDSTGFSGAPLAIIKGKLGLPGGTTPVDALLNENPKLKILFNNVSTIKANGDPKTAKGVVSMLGALLGDDSIGSVLHLDKEFAALQTVLNRAVEMGIPDAMDRALVSVDDYFEKRELATRLLPSISLTGSLADINKLLDVADAHKALAENPNLVKDILANFRLPEGTPYPTVALKNQLVDTLVRINPLWDKAPGFNYTELGIFKTASDAAYNTLLLDSSLAISCTLAREYSNISFQYLVKRDFPKLAI